MSLKAKPVSDIEFSKGYSCNRSAETTYTPSSLNEEKGTVGAVFATETRVLRWHPQVGRYWEQLSFDDGAILLSRIKTAAPVLNRHRSGEDLGIVMGETVTVKDNRMFGDLRFDIGGEAGKDAFRKVKEGFWKTVSVGYDVFKLRFLEDGPDDYPVYRAELWEPFEISIAPMAADIESIIRSAEADKERAKTNFPEIKTKNQVMEETAEQKLAREKREKEASDLQEAQAIETANKRALEITELATKHGRDLVFVKEHIEKKSTVEQVRAALLEDYTTEAEKAPNIRVGGGGIPNIKPEERGLYQAEAILVRMDEKSFPIPAERKQNPYQNKSMLDMAMDYAREHKLDSTGSQRQIVKRALVHASHMRAGGMGTGDFPYLFENVLNKALKKDYNFSSGEWKPLAFKEDALQVNVDESTVGLDNWNALKEVLEGANYEYQSTGDNKELFRAKKYGSIFAITLEMIMNNNIGGIERMIKNFVRTGAFLEDEIVWNKIILGNAKMFDGKAAFHADHNNLATGAAMSFTTLNELYQKIRNQKDGNKKVINLKPKFVVCGPANEATLDQILNKTIVANKEVDAGFTYIKSLTPIVTPYITGNEYFVFADPNGIDILRYGGVTGEPDLAMEEQANFMNDSFDHKARKFFGAAWADYRGAAKNPGQ